LQLAQIVQELDGWTVASAHLCQPANDSDLLIDKPFRALQSPFGLSNEFRMGLILHPFRTAKFATLFPYRVNLLRAILFDI
jgi:hypothetical protein